MDSPANPYALEPARIDWDDGVPVARQFADVYFSRDDGVAESRHVFLHHNDLRQRWLSLASTAAPDAPGTFTIVETGFGTGLNFLLAWHLWQQVAPKHWRLHFISFEKHPLTLTDLQKSHQSWPELQHLAAILQHNYPPLIPGQHRRQMNCEPVCLELIFDEAQAGLTALIEASSARGNGHEARMVDAWFLDGFAPAKNPDMWQLDVLRQLGQLSKIGATFATFTAVGAVRRGLAEQGFAVEKVAGFGRKREMLRGVYQDLVHLHPAPCDQAAPPLRFTPWHQPRSAVTGRAVCIIGGGLAGSSSARALAERGYRVTVIEREAEPARGASGNPQGILYTKLSPDPGSLNRFTLASFLHALAYYRPRLAAGLIAGDLCGVVQVANNDSDITLFKRLETLLKNQDWVEYVDAEGASALAGIPVRSPALFFPGAGWLSPTRVCRYWLDHPNITVHCNRDALSISRDEQAQTWHIRGLDDIALAGADLVVIANSNDAKAFEASRFLPTRPIRGQLTYLPTEALHQPPSRVICHEGYLAPPPPQHDKLCLGASFDLRNPHSRVEDADHHWNLSQLETLSPGILRPGAAPVGGRAALRCASPDYLPIVGPLPDVARFDTDYETLRVDAKTTIDTVGSYLPGLYVNIAHGSRGLTSTPLCAELLASYIAGELSPMSRELCEHLSPARFLIRDLKKRRR
ncbi:bifunctional tRNA (5-methylaminomethyl-2-thiouridine)(34)-methyltransferase MnmD/FAD-dependent 5-carboxymethylaminomethyl-2-thiouridine(34) oxidoreductase MnmC [Spongiibacter taiwanensis]|uniref:bifunctional tRNA (5-methylaminomethyl-2-thiouridine)(34)-methyltransferase MnmD/FAD-dependent 5-carboxymethylaminomethyl-2-thiouridine(34) oxidoreductase MnmC n=1 Tax=Spongiibacter taiwanensis TaxID=1748242 RepID=UPI0020365001|nr:bifunctional tRNA (5-methylaminomethyl-2-thiouridine)(34)-methyltransferase MnmD/FAD-dependent 5-carboxymethylaminomethyl-2-thiouridine(34) oxidoreductase MnmC [Spongiibacter taiwanensis]USA43580.1 bifunctional tRNA (5-methylaminomethyl-2-thiouridine)(34)-methyltransferase MnmD/FAD-dependent 5-carboxymethylaminomethyl-2-thiouridine(34) oxidoreductase MnmC [Spongiibacter taiwanensis]